eukprot:15433811-Alexandrium_andersonii.AAC.1
MFSCGQPGLLVGQAFAHYGERLRGRFGVIVPLQECSDSRTEYSHQIRVRPLPSAGRLGGPPALSLGETSGCAGGGECEARSPPPGPGLKLPRAGERAPGEWSPPGLGAAGGLAAAGSSGPSGGGGGG